MNKLYDIQAEYQVLGSLFLCEDDPKFKDTKQEILKSLNSWGEKSFYFEKHRKIFKAMLSLWEEEKKAIPPAIRDKLESLPTREKIPLSFLADLINQVTSLTSAVYLANKLKKLAGKRNRQEIALLYQKGISNGVDIEKLDAELIENIKLLTEKEIELRKPLTALDILRKDYPEEPFLIDKGFLPNRGYSILAGKAKEGKTQLALSIALHLALSTTFLKEFPISKPAKTLFLLRENLEETIQEFLQKQKRGLEKKLKKKISNKMLKLIVFERPKTTYLDIKEGLTELKSYLENYNPQLVIIDPLSRFLTKDINKMETAIIVANNLELLSNEFNCAFLLLHHVRKQTADEKESGDPFDRITGSSGWRNSYVTGLILERRFPTKSQHIKRLRFEFRTKETPESITIKRDPETLLYELITEEEALEGTSSIKRLRDLIKKQFPNGGKYSDIRMIAKGHFGVTAGRIDHLLKQGTEKGLLAKEKKIKGKPIKYYAL